MNDQQPEDESWCLKEQPEDKSWCLKENYDPYDYGDEKGLTFWEATAHYIKSIVGTGILIVPFAFMTLGYALAFCVLLSAALLYCHAMHILLSCEYRLCRSLKIPRLTLAGVANAAFKNAPPLTKTTGKLLEILVYVHFSIPRTCAQYLVVLSSNVQCILEYLGVKGVNSFYPLTVVFLCLLPFCLIGRLLKFLAPFSALTDTFMLFMAGIVVVCSFVYGEPSPAHMRPLRDFSSVPHFFVIFLMGVSSTGIIIPLKNEMIEPRKFSATFGVFNLTAALTLTFYSFFGLASYLNYGDQIRDNILLNLPPKNGVSLIIYALYTFALFVSYVLSFFVNFHTVWGARTGVKRPTHREKVYEYGVRIGLNIFAYTMAVCVPNLSIIAAISGTIGMIVELIIPPALDILLIVSGGRKTRNILAVLKDLLIIIIGLGLFGMSTLQCAHKIIGLYQT